ncbi:apolipoprotein N-acyltransferase [Nocardioides salsibiostraticola]
MLTRIAGAAVAGAALSLAYEPVAFAYLLPVCVAVLGLVTRTARARSGLLLGSVFGLAFYLPHTFWMSQSIGVGPWLGMSLAIALFYGVFGAVATLFHRLRWWPLWLAIAWVAVEYLRSIWPFSGMPWGRLSFAVVDTPAADALAYVGTTGVSFLLALMGFVISWVVLATGRERLLSVGVLAGVLVVTVAPAALPYEVDVDRTAVVAAVQGNVPGRGNDVLLDTAQLTRNHVDATIDLAEDIDDGRVPSPDFVLWPENSTATDPFADTQIKADLDRAAAAVGVPVVVGAIVDGEPGEILNQGVVWDPVTGAGDRYTKHHPVTFGEYIPFRSYLDGAFAQLDRVPRDMSRSVRRTPLQVAGVSLANSICFDIAYDDAIYDQVRRGAELLTVQTSNAIFIFTDQIDQQFAITRLRAIESGRWLVVASTNGVSGVVAPDGSVVAAADPLTQTVLVEEVELMNGKTPAVWMGLWPARLSWGATILGLILCLIAYSRRRHESPAGTGPQPTVQMEQR